MEGGNGYVTNEAMCQFMYILAHDPRRKEQLAALKQRAADIGCQVSARLCHAALQACRTVGLVSLPQTAQWASPCIFLKGQRLVARACSNQAGLSQPETPSKAQPAPCCTAGRLFTGPVSVFVFESYMQLSPLKTLKGACTSEMGTRMMQEQMERRRQHTGFEWPVSEAQALINKLI